MEKKSFQEEVWDKKKIVFVLVGSTILIAGAIYGTKALGLQTLSKFKPNSAIKGVNTNQQENKNLPKVEIPLQSILSQPKEEAKDKLESIKEEIGKLDVKDIASSSPQVQKVLQDIQSLQQYPRNQAKEMCENICKGL